MTFTVDEAYLPVTLSASPMSDAAFEAFCAQYPDYFIEMTAEGELLVMAPAHSITGFQNGHIGRRLGDWSEKDGTGIYTDSSSGFVLPNGARRSPDAAWTAKSRLRALRPEERQGFWHLSPDFAIELRSGSDRLPALRRKMREYAANGTTLGWLIDPERRAVEIFRPDREPEVLTGIDSIAASSPVEGFTLDLGSIWDPLS